MLLAVALSVLIGFGVSCIAFVASTVFLHRGLAHRAVTFKRPITEIFRFLVWITTGIRPRQWVAVHRKHHAFTDIEGDPHSPCCSDGSRASAATSRSTRARRGTQPRCAAT